MKDKLIAKIHAEQAKYLDRVAKLSPREIIGKAYEICWREEMIISIESSYFSDEDLKVLSKEENLLDKIYDEWLKTDVSVADIVADIIRDFIKK